MSEITPKNITEVESYAKYLFKSTLTNSKFDTAHDIGYVIIYALEKGLPITEAIQQFSILKRGKTALLIAKSEVLLSLVRRSGLLESYCEEIQGKFEDGTATGVVKIKRKDFDERTHEFSIDDAKKAKLWGKLGPWTEYPQRMLIMRARGFALRDEFADVLSGAWSLEEARDIPKEIVIETEQPKQLETKKPEQEEYTQFSDVFDDHYTATTENGKTVTKFKSGVTFSKEEIAHMKTLSKDDRKKLFKEKLEQIITKKEKE
jgi:hypothetical protein